MPKLQSVFILFVCVLLSSSEEEMETSNLTDYCRVSAVAECSGSLLACEEQ